jgi:hypothetical protein
LTVRGPDPFDDVVFYDTKTSDETGVATFSFSLLESGTYTVTGKFLGAVVLNVLRGDHSEYLPSEATDTLTLVVAPPFSYILPLPEGACISTPLVETHALPIVHTWFAKADDSGTMGVTLYARAVNDIDPEAVVAEVFDIAGSKLLELTASYTADEAYPGLEVPVTKQMSTTAGAVYRIEVTTPSPPTPGTQSHYRLKFRGALAAATHSPTFTSLGIVPVGPESAVWVVNVNSSENLQLRIFTEGTIGPASYGRGKLIGPDKAVIDWTVTEPSPGAGIDTTLTVLNAAAGPWRLVVLEMNGHYRLEKLSGTDTGIYASWISYGSGSLRGQILLSGETPFLWPVRVNLYRHRPAQEPILVAWLVTDTGSFSFPKVWVGRYRVEVVPPPGFTAEPAFYDRPVTVCREVKLRFGLHAPVTEEVVVELHTIDHSTKGGATVTPVAGSRVKVFDRDRLNGLEITLLDGSQVTLTKNPDGSLYPDIFLSTEAKAAQVSSSITGTHGRAICGEDAPGNYLVIVYFKDDSGKEVFAGKPKSLDEFVDADGDGNIDPITDTNGDDIADTNGDWKDTDGDGVLDTGATKEFPIIKIIKKDGSIQLGRGSKRVVKGSYLEIIYPEYAVWEEGVTSYVYPFIFTSDSDWTVDVSVEVPPGYEIAGVYDAEGNLIATSNTVHTGVADEKKVIAFEVADLQSPPPHAKAKFKVRGPKGKVHQFDLDVPGHRKGKDDKPGKGRGGSQANAGLLPGAGVVGLAVLAGVGTVGWLRRKRNRA